MRFRLIGVGQGTESRWKVEGMTAAADQRELLAALSRFESFKGRWSPAAAGPEFCAVGAALESTAAAALLNRSS